MKKSKVKQIIDYMPIKISEDQNREYLLVEKKFWPSPIYGGWNKRGTIPSSVTEIKEFQGKEEVRIALWTNTITGNYYKVVLQENEPHKLFNQDAK